MRLHLVLLLVAGGLVLTSCGGSSSRQTLDPDAALAARSTPEMPRRIVDLSPTLTEDFGIRYVGKKVAKTFGLRERTEFEHVVAREPAYVAMSYVTLQTHTGPHHDPPGHVIEGAATSEEIPLDRFFGRARILDFRDRARDSLLLAEDFEDKGIEPDEIVIAVVGYQPPDDLDEYPAYPSLSGEAAEYLATLPVRAFATDMCCLMSFDDLEQRVEAGLEGSENVLPEHYAFMSRGIPAIEALVNAEELIGEEHVVFVGFPLKLEGGTGGLMRAVALLY